MRIIFGIDLSASNEWQGLKTFNGQSLHKTNGTKVFNPYQKVHFLFDISKIISIESVELGDQSIGQHVSRYIYIES